MAIITGTALSTHTPLRVLQELEQGERLEAERADPKHLERSADMREEYIEPQERADADSVNLTS